MLGAYVLASAAQAAQGERAVRREAGNVRLCFGLTGPPPSLAGGQECNRWIMKVMGDCVSTPRQYVAFACGLGEPLGALVAMGGLASSEQSADIS